MIVSWLENRQMSNLTVLTKLFLIIAIWNYIFNGRSWWIRRTSRIGRNIALSLTEGTSHYFNALFYFIYDMHNYIKLCFNKCLKSSCRSLNRTFILFVIDIVAYLFNFLTNTIIFAFLEIMDMRTQILHSSTKSSSHRMSRNNTKCIFRNFRVGSRWRSL